MKNKKENKDKLERRRLFLIHLIRQIDKSQDELMLKNILLNAKKEELEIKRANLDKLIFKATEELTHPRQIIHEEDNIMSTPIILFMN